jgi:dephospho-CoA kinase
MATQLKPRAVALVGMPGAGKSTCAAHLESRGYFQFRFGSIVTDEVARRGLALTPDTERSIREALRQEGGMAVMAARALPILKRALDKHDTIIIDGLYSFSEYKLLKSEFGAELIVVAVVCERDLRYARLEARIERPLSRQQAEERDHLEIENLEKGGPIAIADYTLLNNGPPDVLLQQLDELLERLALIA